MKIKIFLVLILCAFLVTPVFAWSDRRQHLNDLTESWLKKKAPRGPLNGEDEIDLRSGSGGGRADDEEPDGELTVPISDSFGWMVSIAGVYCLFGVSKRKAQRINF